MSASMSKSKTAAGAVVGSALLLGALGGTAGVWSADGVMPAGAPLAAVEAPAGSVASDVFVAASDVTGRFSFTQDAVTPVRVIAGVFNQAVRAVCASVPEYAAPDGGVVVIGGPAAGRPFEATVAELAAAGEATTYVIACACAANAPGGGAIANAEVSGASLRSIAERAQAL